MQIVHREATKLVNYTIRVMRTADEKLYQHVPAFGWRKCVPGGHRNQWTWRKCTPKVAAECEAAWNAN